MSREIKPLRYQSLKGFSDFAIKEHHEVIYADNVKQLNEIENKLRKFNYQDINGSSVDLRETKIEETAEKNSVKLHESYFAQMSAGWPKPVGEIAKMIARDFGSYEQWKKEFEELARASRGWAVLAYDLDDNRLINYLVDSHNQGGVWNAVLLLCLDVCEHAYFLDAAANRRSYIDSFFKNIDWDYVNLAAHQYGIVERRLHKDKVKL